MSQYELFVSDPRLVSSNMLTVVPLEQLSELGSEGPKTLFHHYKLTHILLPSTHFSTLKPHIFGAFLLDRQTQSVFKLPLISGLDGSITNVKKLTHYRIKPEKTATHNSKGKKQTNKQTKMVYVMK